ncbi:MAG: U32 family peptidase [Syntrophomonas sp.]|nr:U32 family peptidase [Syntrophomonas sp.]
MYNHELELLAPAGRMDVLQRVVEAGADAVYLGAKRFNMRALRPDFNFSDIEIKQAAEFLHQKNRKLYITVNNLYNDQEIDEIADYLLFLQEAGIDALIVQDLGIVKVCENLKLRIPLHASVQMGIANLEAVKLLATKGFTRVILSKNVTLPEIASIAAENIMGIEYFCHGDLCISHTGQCYMSSLARSESSNRGKCSKPCRWQYELKGSPNGSNLGYQYLLAHKDLCLYPYLPELINAGVSSFKIEGRMRSADYLAYVVSKYRRALDNLMAQPDSYHMDQDEYNNLHENRIRDFTCGNLFGHVGREDIGCDGQREPLFISTAQYLSPLTVNDLCESLPDNSWIIPELTVQVGDLDSLQVLCAMDVDNIILGCEPMRFPPQNWTYKDLAQALEAKAGTSTKIFLETPRIVSQNNLETIKNIRNMLDSLPVTGIIVNDLGSLKIFINSVPKLWAGYGLNILNRQTASLLQTMGVSRVTASLETDAPNLDSMIKSEIPVELVVHGALPGMICDYCIIRAFQSGDDGECSLYCLQDEYKLVDRCGQSYRIITDINCRNHLLFPFDLCLFQHLPHLLAGGVKSLRINGQYYSIEKLTQVVSIYSETIRDIKKGSANFRNNFIKLLEISPEGLTTASF